jgi:hypothetical protein
MSEKKTAGCFGKFYIVFPMGKVGLRSTPKDCFACVRKTDCLRKALQGCDGFKVRQERIDRAYDGGQINFFERWSQKKALNRRKKSRS